MDAGNYQKPECLWKWRKPIWSEKNVPTKMADFICVSKIPQAPVAKQTCSSDLYSNMSKVYSLWIIKLEWIQAKK